MINLDPDSAQALPRVLKSVVRVNQNNAGVYGSVTRTGTLAVGQSDLPATVVKGAFATRYGPWAIVAGASEGIGAAFAHALAAKGLNLVIVARRAPPLVALADDLETRYKVSVQPLALDLAEPESIAELLSVTSDREIGLLVWNAALSVMGPFLDQPLDAHLMELEVNVRSPLTVVHALGQRRWSPASAAASSCFRR